MNNKLIYLTMVICIAGTTAAMAGGNSDIKTVEKLLNKRTDIMESTLSGNITLDEGRRLLGDVEEGALYADDTRCFDIFTDKKYDKVQDMKVISMEKIKQVSDLMLFEGEIEWSYKRNDFVYSQCNVYNIGVNTDGRYPKLVSLELKQ